MSFDDSGLDPSEWHLQSALSDRIRYRLASREPLEHFDFKQRFLLKNSPSSPTQQSAYCVQFSGSAGSLQEDLLADFLLFQGF